MTETYKPLGQSKPAATTPTDIYTVPAATSAVLSTVFICNQGSVTDTFRVSVRVAGGAADVKQYLVFDKTINAKDAYPILLKFGLAATDVVTVYSGLGNISFNLSGAEIS
jgi:hypothetical protein